MTKPRTYWIRKLRHFKAFGESPRSNICASSSSAIYFSFRQRSSKSLVVKDIRRKFLLLTASVTASSSSTNYFSFRQCSSQSLVLAGIQRKHMLQHLCFSPPQVCWFWHTWTVLDGCITMLGVFPQVSHRLASCRTCLDKYPTSNIYNMDTNCFVYWYEKRRTI
jgi:hypothetical protein